MLVVHLRYVSRIPLNILLNHPVWLVNNKHHLLQSEFRILTRVWFNQGFNLLLQSIIMPSQPLVAYVSPYSRTYGAQPWISHGSYMMYIDVWSILLSLNWGCWWLCIFIKYFEQISQLVLNSATFDPTCEFSVRSWLSELLRVSPAEYHRAALEFTQANAIESVDAITARLTIPILASAAVLAGH